MDETDAVEALESLGLTSYESQVFVALQKLDTASASEVSRVADVPRSQVYGTAEKLEARGLVEVQQSTPLRYRAVDLEEARERLRNRYEARESEAFEHLEEVRSKRRESGERQEAVWTVHGRESVAGRAAGLVREADERILYGGGPQALEDELVAALVEQAGAGVAVTVVSASSAVLDRFEGEADVATRPFPTELAADQRTGRILVVDGETLLLSVLGDEELPSQRTETAIWSAETGFAAVIIQLVHAWLDGHLDR